MRDYHHTEAGLIWIKESKVMGGGEGQIENVLNHPGEIGLKSSNRISSPSDFRFTQFPRTV